MHRSRSLSRQRGVATVEYILVLPIVLLVLLAVVGAGYGLYRQSVLQGAADDLAFGLSCSWSSDPRDPAMLAEWLAGGAVSEEALERRMLYPSLQLLAARRKEDYAGAWGVHEADRRQPVSLPGVTRQTQVSVKFKRGLLQQTLVVKLEEPFLLPLPVSAPMFKGLRSWTLRAEAQADVHNPAEWLRNVDYAGQVAAGTKAGQTWMEWQGTLQSAMEHVTEWMGEGE